MNDEKLEIINKIIGETIPYYHGKYNYHFHCSREEYEIWKFHLEKCKCVKINFQCYNMRNSDNGTGCLAFDFSYVDFIGYKFLSDELVSIYSNIFGIDDARFYFVFTLNIDTKDGRRASIFDARNANIQDIIDYQKLELASKEKKRLIIYNGFLTKAVR